MPSLSVAMDTEDFLHPEGPSLGSPKFSAPSPPLTGSMELLMNLLPISQSRRALLCDGNLLSRDRSHTSPGLEVWGDDVVLFTGFTPPSALAASVWGDGDNLCSTSQLYQSSSWPFSQQAQYSQHYPVQSGRSLQPNSSFMNLDLSDIDFHELVRNGDFSQDLPCTDEAASLFSSPSDSLLEYPEASGFGSEGLASLSGEGSAAHMFWDVPGQTTIGISHPDIVVETNTLSSVPPPDITYTLSIPEACIRSGLLSALQLEAIIYACQQHEVILQNGQRAGFLVGDGAGVGKGRTVAGIILENFLKGRKRALWFSVSNDLKFDAERDLKDIDAPNIPVFALNKIKYGDTATSEGVLFATYSALIGESQAGGQHRTRLKQILDWCKPNFDGVIVFDECHKAKNATSTKMGKAVLDLQSKLPRARVVYASATEYDLHEPPGDLGTRNAVQDLRRLPTRYREEVRAHTNGKEELFSDWLENGKKELFSDWLANGKEELFSDWLKKGKEELFSDWLPNGKEELFSDWLLNGKEELFSDWLANGKEELFSDWLKKGKEELFSDWLPNGKEELFSDWLPNGKEELFSDWLKKGKEELFSDWLKKGKEELFSDWGVGAMEIVAMDMKVSGMYIARQLSFSGVSFRIEEISLDEEFKLVYNKAARLWAEALELFNLAADSLGLVSRKSLWGQFWSSHQRFFKYLCIAAKVRRLVELAHSEMQQGKCIVIGLQSTGEARTREVLDENDGHLDKFVSAAEKVFQSLVQKHFPTEKPKRDKSAANKRKRKPRGRPSKFPKPCVEVGGVIKISDDSDTDSEDMDSESNSSPESLQDNDDVIFVNHINGATARLEELKQRLLGKISELGKELPLNTLDELIDRFGGPEKVSEMTGRKGRVVRRPDNSVRYESRAEQGLTIDHVNVREKERFMSGEKLIAIISEAASSGISLQADKRVLNQRRRVHMTLELPWSADRAIQQFGRTHRSNQVTAPEYIFLISELAGERRFASIVAKRLESLGALTHGDRRATESRDLSQYNFENKYGSKALDKITKAILGHIDNKVPPPKGYPGGGAMFFRDMKKGMIDVGIFCKEPRMGLNTEKDCTLTKFLNRILGLEVHHQNFLFQYFTDNFDYLIDKDKKEGKYDMGILDLAPGNDEIHEETQEKFLTPGNPQEGTVILYKISVDRGMPWSEACSKAEKLSGEHDGFYLSNKLRGSQPCVLLAEQGRGRNLILYKPNIGKQVHPENLDNVLLRYYKALQEEVPPDDAKEVWESQFDFSFTNCTHANWKGKCKMLEQGQECFLGMRLRQYHMLCGALLRVWNRVSNIVMDITSSSILQIVRLKTKQNSKQVGIKIPENCVSRVRSELARMDEEVKKARREREQFANDQRLRQEMLAKMINARKLMSNPPNSLPIHFKFNPRPLLAPKPKAEAVSEVLDLTVSPCPSPGVKTPPPNLNGAAQNGGLLGIRRPSSNIPETFNLEDLISQEQQRHRQVLNPNSANSASSAQTQHIHTLKQNHSSLGVLTQHSSTRTQPSSQYSALLSQLRQGQDKSLMLKLLTQMRQQTSASMKPSRIASNRNSHVAHASNTHLQKYSQSEPKAIRTQHLDVPRKIQSHANPASNHRLQRLHPSPSLINPSLSRVPHERSQTIQPQANQASFRLANPRLQNIQSHANPSASEHSQTESNRHLSKQSQAQTMQSLVNQASFRLTGEQSHANQASGENVQALTIPPHANQAARRLPSKYSLSQTNPLHVSLREQSQTLPSSSRLPSDHSQLQTVQATNRLDAEHSRLQPIQTFANKQSSRLSSEHSPLQNIQQHANAQSQIMPSFTNSQPHANQPSSRHATEALLASQAPNPPDHFEFDDLDFGYSSPDSQLQYPFPSQALASLTPPPPPYASSLFAPALSDSSSSSLHFTPSSSSSSSTSSEQTHLLHNGHSSLDALETLDHLIHADHRQSVIQFKAMDWDAT
ncbi:hypothetical protein DNTS_032680 [Danionella cerebrum]|uniref:Protein strawberry notch homolog 2 n=2 Tax=Cyprinoidei TaxID=30727 RepID=A0A553MPV3_9TELE|nr:hypothetical protein DNTS_032680 [Danionella translucida]